MNRYKFVSYLFVLLGLLVIIGSSYVIISYASDILGAIVDFVTSNDLARLQQCGVTPPSQFNKIKGDLTTTILPFLYIGLPLLFIVISVILFLAGFYYHKGKHEDDIHMNEKMERDMLHKLVKKIETEKPAAPKATPSAKPPARFEEPGEEVSEEAGEAPVPEEEEVEEVAEEAEEEPEPPRKSSKKRR